MSEPLPEKITIMKRFISGFAGLAVLLAVCLAFTFRAETGIIKGRIIPPDGAVQIWAISGADTLKTTPANGEFIFERVKAGKYTLAVDAKDPYKDQMIENVEVKAGEVKDLGEIRLSQ